MSHPVLEKAVSPCKNSKQWKKTYEIYEIYEDIYMYIYIYIYILLGNHMNDILCIYIHMCVIVWVNTKY